jgi:hypothetical protein
MLTTITVNGVEGIRFLVRLSDVFLASLTGGVRRPVPPALAAMIEHVVQAGLLSSPDGDLEQVRLEVASPLAEEIAAFVDDLSGGGTPLLFSAQIGDLVVTVRDALVEMHGGKREAKTWRFLPRGTHGRLMSKRGDFGKLFLLDGPLSREHAYVSDRCTTRTRMCPSI